MPSRLPVLVPVALSLVAFGCSCSSGSRDGDGSVRDAAVADGSSEDASRGDGGKCLGSLCGMPAVCCAPSDECVNGACLAACASGVRCGTDSELCCPEGQLCVSQACTNPGGECGDAFDCDIPGEFCEPTLGKCLPQPDPLTCEVVPKFDEIDIDVEWSFEDDQIISIPTVADVDGDDVPEVAVNLTQQDGGEWQSGNILVLAGDTGATQVRIPHSPGEGQYGSHGRSSIALGDVSGDGLPDIVYAARPGTGPGRSSLIVAVDHEGMLLWTSHDDGGAHGFSIVNGGATLANFDGDPEAEVVFGASLIDDDGRVVWDEGGNGATYGTNSGYSGGISAVADLDDDGSPEIVSGRNAWTVDWIDGDPPTADVTPYWTYAGADGYPAIADLDGNGSPEVILVASGEVIALEGTSGELWCGVDPTGVMCDANDSLRTSPIAIPGGASNNRGGPPTVADFDGDDRPEIGVAGGYAYSVYDANREGEDIVTPEGDPTPDDGALFVRWSHDTQDLSSNATGSSVFDFQGDGEAEVVYADECYMRVYSGTDGSLQLETPSTSATIHEYPLVVDVDGDNNSEILVVANDKSCDGMEANQGLFVYGDPNDEWVPTRRVWTQHTYHVSNTTSDGNVPATEMPNWTTPGLNNYRQNVQGEGVFNAPDLTVSLSAGLDRCIRDELVLRARVSNDGALGAPAGVEVTFHEGADPSGPIVGTAETEEALLPGASTIVELVVDAPEGEADYSVRVDGSEDAGSVTECREDNNTDAATGITCTFLG